jgi:prepilin-type N-terminal cleavage/methylation domain-containing protein
MNARRGYTLIELVVAMALLVIFIAIAFSTFNSMVWQRAAARETLQIQGALSAASESLSEDVRLAGWPGYTGSAQNPYIVSPPDGGLSDSLTIIVPDASSVTYVHEVRYYIDSSAGAERLMREDCQLPTASTAALTTAQMNASSTTQWNPVTPYFKQTLHMYFSYQGGRVATVMVARLQLQGRSRDVTVVAITHVRNVGP